MFLQLSISKSALNQTIIDKRRNHFCNPNHHCNSPAQNAPRGKRYQEAPTREVSQTVCTWQRGMECNGPKYVKLDDQAWASNTADLDTMSYQRLHAASWRTGFSHFDTIIHKKRVAENPITSAWESKFGSHAYKSNIKAILVESYGAREAIARKCNNSEIVHAHVDFLCMWVESIFRRIWSDLKLCSLRCYWQDALKCCASLYLVVWLTHTARKAAVLASPSQI